jgi:hypothetical protein
MRELEGNGSGTWKHNTSKSGWRAKILSSELKKNEGGRGEHEGNMRGTRPHNTEAWVSCNTRPR